MPRRRNIGADDVLAALVSHIQQDGHPPSMRELADELGFASHSALNRYLYELRDDGRIAWEPGKPRTVRVLNGQKEKGSTL